MDFRETKPRFLVLVTATDRPSGPETDFAFPELWQIVKEDYKAVYWGDGFCIFCRNGANPPVWGEAR